MPSANARAADKNQEEPAAPRLSIAKFAGIAAMLGSDNKFERDNAITAANRLLEAANVHWIEFVGAYERAEKADEATVGLLTQIAGLQAENDQLRAERSQGNTLALWADVGSKLEDHRVVARWALDLHARQAVGITMKEVEFLENMTRWRGQPTPKQEAWLLQIIGGVVRRTGQTPPAT